MGKDETENVLIWPLSPSGSYGVRSAYRMLMEAETSALPPSSSSPMSTHSIWKKNWKLKAPNKVCHFLWRATKDSLPTKQNLILGIFQSTILVMVAVTNRSRSCTVYGFVIRHGQCGCLIQVSFS